MAKDELADRRAAKEARHKARELRRGEVLWELARAGNKGARKAVVIKGGKK